MNSALNPEAPEFYPHCLSSVTKGGYTTVYKSICSSNHLPRSTSYEMFKTFTDFNIVTSQLDDNVFVQSNQIVTTELPIVKLKRVLDRVNTHIDTACNVNKRSDKFIKGIMPGIDVSSWNKSSRASVISKFQLGSRAFIGAKNIPRPQLTFKDTIDNSNSLWVPKISDKPNNIKPLALNILYNDEGEAIGYEHPYEIELNLYHPPSKYLDPDPEPPSFPAPLEKTRLIYVATEEQVDDLVKHLSGVKEMAVDVEHHSYRTYQGITCLIQISTDEGGDFIVDALAVREHIHKLNLVFTDPKKIKVLHGAEMDVIWLQRDFGVYIIGLFDTHQAAKALSLNGLSLKYLLKKYCQLDCDKKYQMADWRIRPLPEELMKYARMDTHCLLYIWRKMKSELLEKAAGQPHLLLSVFEQSRQICGTTYNKEVIHDNSHMPLYVRAKKSFNSQQMALLQLLYKWRDAQARALDESTAYLLPNHMLLALAESVPREMQGVYACCHPMPPFVKQNIITIHRMVLSCRELPPEPQLYQMPLSIRNMVDTAHQPLTSCKFHDLSQLPDFREGQGINLDHEAYFKKEHKNLKSEVKVFVPMYANEKYHGIVSDLNADAKMFIPPYDRYRKHRALAQMEELKEYKDKEAKIAAIGKGNELIRSEVLIKIQAKIKVDKDNEEVIEKDVQTDNLSQKKAEKRKRKMSIDKIVRKDPATQVTGKLGQPTKNLINDTETQKIGNPFYYKNINYKKVFSTDNLNKQPKQKFKKHK